MCKRLFVAMNSGQSWLHYLGGLTAFRIVLCAPLRSAFCSPRLQLRFGGIACSTIPCALPDTAFNLGVVRLCRSESPDREVLLDFWMAYQQGFDLGRVWRESFDDHLHLFHGRRPASRTMSCRLTLSLRRHSFHVLRRCGHQSQPRVSQIGRQPVAIERSRLAHMGAGPQRCIVAPLTQRKRSALRQCRHRRAQEAFHGPRHARRKRDNAPGGSLPVRAPRLRDRMWHRRRSLHRRRPPHRHIAPGKAAIPATTAARVPSGEGAIWRLASTARPHREQRYPMAVATTAWQPSCRRRRPLARLGQQPAPAVGAARPGARHRLHRATASRAARTPARDRGARDEPACHPPPPLARGAHDTARPTQRQRRASSAAARPHPCWCRAARPPRRRLHSPPQALEVSAARSPNRHRSPTRISSGSTSAKFGG